MVGDGVPGLVCKCKIEDGEILFCPLHRAAEELLTAVNYVHTFLAPRKLAIPEQEATKIQTVLPYLEKVLAKARGKAE
jgi:hypothetical protein